MSEFSVTGALLVAHKSNVIDSLDSFTRAYIEAMLWSSNDESTPSGGEPLDSNYDINDLTPKCLDKCIEDCNKFQKENAELLSNNGCDDSKNGHNFWLNRNSHGSGFWDEFSQTTCDKYKKEQAIAVISRDFSKREALNKTCNCYYHVCQRLSDACNKYGGINPFVVNGKIILE